VSVLGIKVAYYVGGTENAAAFREMAFAFERAGAELAKPGKHIFPRIIPVLQNAVRMQFATQGSGPTGPWKPLSSKYQAWKEVHYPGRPILVRSGKLRGALTGPHHGNALREVTDDVLTYGTKGVGYASHHQVGADSLPARPVFDFGPEFEAEVYTEARLGVMHAIREAKVSQFAEVKE
jgi:phage gpG-like protein